MWGIVRCKCYFSELSLQQLILIWESCISSSAGVLGSERALHPTQHNQELLSAFPRRKPDPRPGAHASPPRDIAFPTMHHRRLICRVARGREVRLRPMTGPRAEDHVRFRDGPETSMMGLMTTRQAPGISALLHLKIFTCSNTPAMWGGVHLRCAHRARMNGHLRYGGGRNGAHVAVVVGGCVPGGRAKWATRSQSREVGLGPESPMASFNDKI